jgi:hypothetical protein
VIYVGPAHDQHQRCPEPFTVKQLDRAQRREHARQRQQYSLASIPYRPDVFVASIGEHRKHEFIAVRIAVMDVSAGPSRSGYSVLVIDV